MIASEILGYLETHQDAGDTLRGIVGWWLEQHRIEIVTKSVKAALDELVAVRLVECRALPGSPAKPVYVCRKQPGKTARWKG